MELITNIVIHCSDSTWGCAREIDKWHKNNGWTAIGYSFVIMNGIILPNFNIPALDGSIECGRFLDEDNFIEDNEIGAHTLGYNDNSVGICLIGADKFSPAQFLSLRELLRDLTVRWNIPKENIIGHYETESGKEQGKTCPNFDMKIFRGSLWA